ncbi:MAG TPA: hypothetical protein VIC85_19940 [Ktedonobacterales bacterium]|jgi:hypothetical protein
MSTSATPTRGGCLGFVVDVWRGAVIGDFATKVGFFGALTQALLGFVPVIGTLCAVRDLIADMRMGDRLGMLLNALAIFPVFGGVPKTIEVIHHLNRPTRLKRQAAERNGA